MSQFWLPVDRDTATKSEVMRIARQLEITRHDALGRVLCVWFWFNVESVDGVIAGATLDDVDDIAARPGFGQAMLNVGWLVQLEAGLEQPGFHEHRQVSQKELRKRQRAIKSKSKTELVEVLEGTAESPEEFRSWLVELLEKRGGVPDELGDDGKPSGSNGEPAAAQQSCANGAATRKRTRRKTPDPDPQPAGRPETAQVVSVPRLTSTPPVEVNGLTSTIPAEFAGQLVQPEEPPAGYFSPASAFDKLADRHVRSPQLLSEWHRRQLTLSDPPVGGTVADLLLVLAAAKASCGPSVKKPVALFVATVARQRWNKCERALPAVVANWQQLLADDRVDTDRNWIAPQTADEVSGSVRFGHVPRGV